MYFLRTATALPNINSKPEWQMVEVYADNGIFATSTAKREEFNRMIADCKAGRIDMILTKSISRFARNTVDCLKYTRELKALNIAVFYEKENINTLDAKGELLITIMAALAQQESESLSAMRSFKRPTRSAFWKRSVFLTTGLYPNTMWKAAMKLLSTKILF